MSEHLKLNVGAIKTVGKKEVLATNFSYGSSKVYVQSEVSTDAVCAAAPWMECSHPVTANPNANPHANLTCSIKGGQAIMPVWRILFKCILLVI